MTRQRRPILCGFLASKRSLGSLPQVVIWEGASLGLWVLAVARTPAELLPP